MDEFLMTITVGEYVASQMARDLARFFRSGKGEHQHSDLVAVYECIERDEVRHFKLMRGVIKSEARLPEFVRSIYRGSLLMPSPAPASPELPIDHQLPELQRALQAMIVIHTVFEAASFAYMTEIARRQEFAPALREVAKIILVDEARHMLDGIQAIKKLRPMVSPEYFNDLKTVAEQHAQALRELPERTLLRVTPTTATLGNPVRADYHGFQSRLWELFDRNISHNLRVVFQ